MNNESSVAIVGFGPSAMYAVLACNSVGIIPKVYANRLSIPRGAFWLYKLPDLDHRFMKHSIVMKPQGSEECYIEKQWDEVPIEYKSSFPPDDQLMYGFDPEIVLPSILFNTSKCEVTSLESNITDNDLYNMSNQFNYVFHSFPTERARKKYRDKIVEKRLIYIDAERAGKDSLVGKFKPDNVVVYDGSYGSIFVRKSFLFGNIYLEIGKDEYPGVENRIFHKFSSARIVKFKDLMPTDFSDGYLPIKENIIPIGRNATFNRKELSHDTYERVLSLLKRDSNVS